MKKIIYLAIAVFFIFCPKVNADDVWRIAGENEYNRNVERISSGNFTLSPSELLEKGADMLLKEISESRASIISILSVAALSGILNVMQGSFGGGICSESAFFACFTLSAVSASKLLSEAVGYGAEVVQSMTDFITKICPVVTILIASGGNSAAAGSFYPVLSSAVYVVSLIINKCIIPLVYLSAILGIVNNLSMRVQLVRLNNLIKSVSKWILTATLTVFTGITAIYGFSVPVIDAVALKTLKFTVGSCVPVVGGLMADTVETVISGAKVMKNAVGTAGILAVLGICIVPVIKLCAIILMLKLSAAAAEPLCDKRISGMLSDMASPITTVFSMVIASAMLFVISIAVIMGATA